MSFIDLDVHADRLSQLQTDLQATDTEVRQALRSTLGKMGRWMRTQSARGLSKELDLKPVSYTHLTLPTIYSV